MWTRGHGILRDCLITRGSQMELICMMAGILSAFAQYVTTMPIIAQK